MACATAARAAAKGYRTVVISADPAHSVADVLLLKPRAFAAAGRGLRHISDNLWFEELRITDELSNRWNGITSFWSKIFRDVDLSDLLAEELAILPGMQETAVLLRLADYHRDDAYDLAVVDCAPTAEALRFLSVPKTIHWYVRKILGLQRTASKILRPMQKYGAKIPVADEDYFDDVRSLSERLAGLDKILEDPVTTSVRMVTLPEKIVLQETRRALLYLSLYGLNVDMCILNRVLPETADGQFFGRLRETQAKYVAEAQESFAPIPIVPVPFQESEPLGLPRLMNIADAIYDGRDPVVKQYQGSPFHMAKRGNGIVIELQAPFAASRDIQVSQNAEELNVRIGDHIRKIPLPTRYSSEARCTAELRDHVLTIIVAPPD
jgi:arsenite-transporting ATPase